MVYCAICENEFADENTKKVISKKGIVSVCLGCYNEDMPSFEEPSAGQFEGIYTRKSVYSRLSESAGVGNVEEHKKRISDFGKNNGLVKDESLRRIVNKNFEDKAKLAPKNENLIDNFHWVIMRARRSKKISQGQLAEVLQEPEVAIAMAEKGVIPEGGTVLIRKLESFLGIKILKGESPLFHKGFSEYDLTKKELLEKFDRDGEFDVLTTKNLTLDDLKEHDKRKKRKFWLFGKREDKNEEKAEDSEEDLDNPFFKKAE